MWEVIFFSSYTSTTCFLSLTQPDGSQLNVIEANLSIGHSVVFFVLIYATEKQKPIAFIKQ